MLLFQFLGEVDISEAFDFGGEGLWEEFGVDFFGRVGAAVADEAADGCHAQSAVEGGKCKIPMNEKPGIFCAVKYFLTTEQTAFPMFL